MLDLPTARGHETKYTNCSQIKLRIGGRVLHRLMRRVGCTCTAPDSVGFTLIELLVVIAIIGLLASVVLVSLNSARSKSRDSRRAADMKQMVSALSLYYNDYAGYPAASGTVPGGLVPNYVGSLPTDPTPAGNGCASGYTYAHSGTGYTSPLGGTVYPDFTYTFCLGAVTGSYTAGIHTASGKGIQ